MMAPLGLEHIDDVARLHCDSLKGLLSALGMPAVKAFYAGCAQSDAAVGFVYLDNGHVQGYVLGSIHPDTLKREALRKNRRATLTGLCAGIVIRPASLWWLLKSFGGPDEGSYNDHAPELTYLAVAPESRTGGVGRRLVDAFTGAMRDAGVSAYELSVDDDNEAAIAFYEKLRFRMIGRYREFGTLHRRYRLEQPSETKAPLNTC